MVTTLLCSFEDPSQQLLRNFSDASEPKNTGVTAAVLLAYMSAAIVLQLAAGVAFSFFRRATGAVVSGGVNADARAAPSSKAAWAGWRDFRVVRRQYEDAAESQCSFYLEPADGVPLPAFKPGQYLTFQLQPFGLSEKAPAQERTIVRCYSLSDAPVTAAYRVTIKRALAPPGRPEVPPGVSSTHFHDHVKVGDVLQLKAPAGNFYLDGDWQTPLALIAGGVGVTPMMSMLRSCLAMQPDREIYLYYGVRHSGEHAFKALLEALAVSNPHFHLHSVYSSPAANDVIGNDYQHAGYIDVALLRRTLPHGRHEFYVCGPPAMMESLVPAIIDWGVPASDVHFEAFGPATVRAELVSSMPSQVRPEVLLDVQFLRSGRTVVWNGADKTLLDFAERNGVVVDSGCRSGGCGSCETKLLSGSVAYANKPDYDITPGHCLLCVGTPQSALVLEA